MTGKSGSRAAAAAAGKTAEITALGDTRPLPRGLSATLASRGRRGLRFSFPGRSPRWPCGVRPCRGRVTFSSTLRRPWGNRSAAGSPLTSAEGCRDPPRLPTRVHGGRRGGWAAGWRARRFFALACSDSCSHEQQQQRGVSSVLSAVSACFSS